MVLAGVALVAGACSPESDGLTGVGVDGAGRPVGYLLSCKHRIDGATLYWPADPAGADSQHATAGEWTMPSNTRRVVTWLLDSGAPGGGVQSLHRSHIGSGVISSKPAIGLDQSRKYALYGWTHDNSYTAGRVEFSGHDLAGLQPGQVLLDASGDDPPHDRKIVSRAQFEHAACSS